MFTTYAYGQSEDYSINFIENLGMSDINSKILKSIQIQLKIFYQSILKSNGKKCKNY